MRHQKNSSVVSYPHTFGERMYSLFFAPVLLVVVFFVVAKLLHFSGNFSQISFYTLGLAGLSTTYRLVVAYCFAVVVAVPLAILATKNSFMENIFLPIFWE